MLSLYKHQQEALKGKEVRQFYKNLILLKKFMDNDKRRPKKRRQCPR